ncbi:glycosyltransferase [Aquihabitans sp. G128]|uniref:glycosyltransferase family 2 protein n=1 Tax=Aquihabitans sp. G128 TaxID=2849779 RepID=UPI001C24E453|nr:glycosyltransferase family 2 protein [Aquihabitans sp. G128]QXC59131.1 glycosyltransferase [Aquihabitans sp. G128]
MTTGEVEGDGESIVLTVVISTHSRPVQLREAIAAIRDQDHPGAIETIVVWDKTDPEPELASDDPHRPVRILANDRTPGLPGSRNCGAAAARGPVLGFCDDDDLWLPDKARRQLDLLERTGADTCSSGLEVVIDGQIIPRPGVDGVLRYVDLLRTRRMEAYMGTAMVRRDAFWGEIGPMDEHIPGGYAEDYEWMLRATRHAPVPVEPEPLLQMRWIVRSHFRDQWPDWEAALGQVLRDNPDFSREPQGRARVEGQIAVAIAAQGRRADALRQVGTTLRWSWREPRAAIALAVAAGLPAGKVSAFLNKRGRGI